MYDIKKVKQKIRSIGLTNKNFTIISNNCWGGTEYQYFGLEYRTPFIGLFIREDDYVRLLSDFSEYMKLPLRFKPNCESKYTELRDKKWPLAMLGDVEVHFMHYKSEDEAQEKWKRRSRRINQGNMMFKLSQRTECCTREIQKQFLGLPVKNKILFTQDESLSQENESAIYIPELQNITSGTENGIVRKHINTKKLFNKMKINIGDTCI